MERTVWTTRAVEHFQHSVSPTRRVVFQIIRYAYGSPKGDSLILRLIHYCDTTRSMHLATIVPDPGQNGIQAMIDNSTGYAGLSCRTWSLFEDTVYFQMWGSTLNTRKDSKAELFKIGVPWVIPPDGRTGLADAAPQPEIVSVTSLPNPFSASTLIRFSLSKAVFVSVDIFNADGQLIRVLGQNNFTAGAHEIQWDGRDHRGNPVANGQYFYQVISGGEISGKSLLLLK